MWLYACWQCWLFRGTVFLHFPGACVHAMAIYLGALASCSEACWGMFMARCSLHQYGAHIAIESIISSNYR